jgi:hypothetical protein
MCPLGGSTQCGQAVDVRHQSSHLPSGIATATLHWPVVGACREPLLHLLSLAGLTSSGLPVTSVTSGGVGAVPRWARH